MIISAVWINQLSGFGGVVSDRPLFQAKVNSIFLCLSHSFATSEAVPKGYQNIKNTVPQKMCAARSTDTTTRNLSLREIVLARALYKCGDYRGLGRKILNEYEKDYRGYYSRHAHAILKNPAGRR